MHYYIITYQQFYTTLPMLITAQPQHNIANIQQINKVQNPNHQSINRNCLNSSTTKQLYSFPKQSRFSATKLPVTSRTDFFNYSTLDGRKAHSFTKSKRQLVFHNEQQYSLHPPPNIYNSIVKENKPAITMAPKYRIYNPKKLEKYPGPGQYQIKQYDPLNKSNQFSKQKRQLKYPIQNIRGQGSPGPYLIQTYKLKSILSTYKNIKNTKFHQKTNLASANKIKAKIELCKQKLRDGVLIPKKQSFRKQKQVKSTFNSTVIFKRQKTTVFGTQSRKTFFDIKNKNPSPSNYSFFSQFANLNKPNLINTKNKRSRSLKKSKFIADINQRMKTLPTVM